jgi:deoxyribodipyrimidine photo-lyase
VAGTFSAKPYLFNADNVARFAPPGWQSPGSVIDTDYGTLEACARGQLDLPHEPLPAEAGVTEPQQLPEPPGGWPSPAVLPNEVRVVELVHPWSLQAPAAGARSPARLRVGWLLPAAHGTWPWSALRWNFVLTRLHQVCDHVATLDAPTLRGWQTRGITLVAAACRMPAYADVLSQLRIEPIVERPLFPDAGRESASFTRYYQSLQSLAPDFSRLIE